MAMLAEAKGSPHGKEEIQSKEKRRKKRRRKKKEKKCSLRVYVRPWRPKLPNCRCSKGCAYRRELRRYDRKKNAEEGNPEPNMKKYSHIFVQPNKKEKIIKYKAI